MDSRSRVYFFLAGAGARGNGLSQLWARLAAQSMPAPMSAPQNTPRARMHSCVLSSAAQPVRQPCLVERVGADARTGELSEDEARSLFEMHKRAVQSVLVTANGLGELAARNAVGIALSALASPVNESVGFKLL
jgi:hypothetical protein